MYCSQVTFWKLEQFVTPSELVKVNLTDLFESIDFSSVPSANLQITGDEPPTRDRCQVSQP